MRLNKLFLVLSVLTASACGDKIYVTATATAVAGVDTTHHAPPIDTTKKDTTTSPSTTTVAVTPKTLDLFIGQFGQLTATVTVSSGTAPTPTWSKTNSCISLSTAIGTITSVSANAVCNTYVVASANGIRDSALVNVTSGASSCTWANIGGSAVYNAYIVGVPFNAFGGCVFHGVAQQPYWYSKDPSRFTVLGAPFVCMISGVGYPCGTSATIKPIFVGTADVCVQAAVQDPNMIFCRTLTSVAGLSASMVQGDIAEGYSMVLPTAPPKGAKVDRIIPWAEWVATHR